MTIFTFTGGRGEFAPQLTLPGFYPRTKPPDRDTPPIAGTSREAARSVRNTPDRIFPADREWHRRQVCHGLPVTTCPQSFAPCNAKKRSREPRRPILRGRDKD